MAASQARNLVLLLNNKNNGNSRLARVDQRSIREIRQSAQL